MIEKELDQIAKGICQWRECINYCMPGRCTKRTCPMEDQFNVAVGLYEEGYRINRDGKITKGDIKNDEALLQRRSEEKT